MSGPEKRSFFCDLHQPFVVNIPFKYFVIVGVSLPLFGMWGCALLSTLFSFDEVTESVCGVSNFIPSISAVTGITPQLYFWRYAIGFHSAPRILLAATYYQYHRLFTQRLSSPRIYDALTKIALFLNMIDVITFVGVAFVSNGENYPVHERLFIVFLFASSLYMLVVLIIHGMLRQNNILSQRMKHSYKMKFAFFITTLLLIAILVYHFCAHRFFCKPNAFSWFSATEYGIAVANMGFHLTAAYDFQHVTLTTAIAKPHVQ